MMQKIETPKNKQGNRVRNRTTIDGAHGDLVMMSFRAERDVIDGIKKYAKEKNWPYQAVVRKILKGFLDSQAALATPTSQPGAMKRSD